jgi:FkbM family methyltransferase
MKTLIKNYKHKIRPFLKRNLLRFLINFGYSNSLNRIDLQITNLFNEMKGGFFLEIGAADGVDCSNTYLLEKKYNWKGILIEPLVEQFILCKKIRKKSIVENYILTNEKEKDNIFRISDEGLMSRVIVENEEGSYSEYFEKISYKEKKPSKIVENKTLTQILNDHSIENVDIMSLDVEGYEYKLLEGYDHNTKIINYLIVEADLEIFKEFAQLRGWRYIETWDGAANNNHLFKLR